MASISPELARNALDSAPDAIVIMDTAGLIRYSNRQVAVLFGYEQDETIGVRFESLMPARVKARPATDEYESVGVRRDGSEFPLEFSMCPIEDGEKMLLACAIRDSTDRRRVEDDLTIARDGAESMREVADAASRGKSRFLATASHDLRQPMQALTMLNGTLRRMVTAKTVVDLLSQQEKAIAVMSRLLNALLDISKLESGAIKPDPSDFMVAAIFDELRLEFDSLALEKGLSLEFVDGVDPVHTDPSLLEQILRNLVSNALKYTCTGGVRVNCTQAGGLVRVEVSDTGIGIPSDQLALIFDEYHQVSVAGHNTHDGYGLGLNIVHRLVALLMLKLEVRSKFGQGTVFSLSIPAGNAVVMPLHPKAQNSAITKHSLVGGVSVLLVEDDIAVRRATCMLLELEGYNVTPVASLPEAMRHVHAGNTIDIVVSDYHLSQGVTGTQVIDALRGVLGKSLPVILATGDTSSLILRLPRDPYLRITSKPVKAEELLTLLPGLLAV